MLLQQDQQKRLKRRFAHKCQQGVVIVVALFIVALVAAMAYVMMARFTRDTERTGLILRSQQAEYYAEGSMMWARDALSHNWEKHKTNQLVDVMPMQSEAIDMDGYKITSTIYDMQARFNINNLNDPEAQKAFKKLLQMVDPKSSDENNQQIIRAVVDWITPGVQKSEFNQYYFELPLPYRSAHRLMQSASELRLVKGVTPALFNAIQPYVVALPGTTQVNVQTASSPVLAMLSPTMTLDTAKAVEDLRRKAPFVSAQQFLNLDVVKNHSIMADKLTVTSSYFLVETEIAIEKQHIVLYTLLSRIIKNDRAQITTLWQSKGTY